VRRAPSHGATAERREDVRRRVALFALPGPQCPEFRAAQRVGGWRPVLEPGDVQQAGLQIDLIPAQGDQLGSAQTMAVGQHDQQGVALTHASTIRGRVAEYRQDEKDRPLYPITHVCVLPARGRRSCRCGRCQYPSSQPAWAPVLVSLDWTDYGQEAVAPWPRERSIGPAALPKMVVVGNAIWSNPRRSQENRRRNPLPPNTEMGKAEQYSAHPPA